VRAGNLVTLLQKDMIKRHILSYDYIAAMNIARTMDLSIRNDIVNLLEAAAGRLQLNFAKVKAYSQHKKYSMLIAKNEEEQKLIEYILALEIKIKKRELADFVRAITPAVLELFKRILEVNCSLRIDDYLRKDAADAALKWDVDALNQTELEDALNKRYNGFRGGIVYSAHFEVLIKQYADKDVIRRASKMVGVEQNVRNMAAHNMASVSDKDILSLTSHHGMPGMNAKQIYELLQQLTDDAGITMAKADWNSYDIMNQKMISYIDTITLD